ncbi:MAG: hypothetical protein ABI723_12465 [Bacteroidia bacterium]
MFYRWLFPIIICSAFLFSTCTNQLDVTTSYKDTTIVYCLLSPSDSVQYIKIYKAFIGDGNAYEFAQQADSFYFPDILKVQLLRIKNGEPNDTIILKRDTLSPMVDGVFASAPNVVYTTTANIDISSQYRLNINNLKSGSAVTATTVIPSESVVSDPSPLDDEIKLVSGSTYTISWQSGINAKVYNAVMRFHYEEVTAGITTSKFIDWPLGDKIVKDPSVIEYFDLVKSKDGFYKNLEKNLSVPDSLTYRIAGKIELIFAGAATDYYYYQKINNASVGVNQSIPDFTNIQNGLGIFSAKTISGWSFDLDAASLDYLKNGPYTSQLKFN